jgi:hypothetical protein
MCFTQSILHQQFSQSDLQKPILKLQRASIADAEAQWLGKTPYPVENPNCRPAEFSSWSVLV